MFYGAFKHDYLFSILTFKKAPDVKQASNDDRHTPKILWPRLEPNNMNNDVLDLKKK